MEYENPTSRQCLDPDFISHVPQNIIESILSLLPLRDAVRTSILSKKWRYSWRGMPKLTFRHNMVRLRSSWVQSTSGCTELKRELAKAIYHVLLLHKGPQILEFRCSVSLLHMESEFAQMISYLAMRNCVKELCFEPMTVNNYYYLANNNSSYKLPSSFFSLQGLELMHLQNCSFEPPLTVKGFSQLRKMIFGNVEVTTQVLQRFLSKCPLLEDFVLIGTQENDFAAEGNKFTLVDLLLCVPLIKTLTISKYYLKYLCAGASPHNLPTSLVHLQSLFLDVCLTEQNIISFTLCMLKSSPVLNDIVFLMYDNEKLHDQQTPTHFLDSENHPDLKLDHLEKLDIRFFSNFPLEIEFVKLIMAKSPKLEKVRIVLNSNVSVDEELKILRAMLLLPPSLRASASAKITVVRPKTS